MQVGDFCWIELATGDLTSGLKFYQNLFNWKTTLHPMPEWGDYAMLRLATQAEEHGFGGGYQITPEMATQGIPPNWAAYVLVPSVDATTEQAKKLGASVIKAPFDVMDFGRMAVLKDPTDAVFLIWENKKSDKMLDAELPEATEHGNPSWFELLSGDCKKAVDFYCKLFGWTAEVYPYAEGEYTQLFNKGHAIAGAMQIPPQMSKECPAHWGIYFAVKDFTPSFEKAKALGATSCYEPKSVPGVGQFCTLIDPQGVHFSIFKGE